MASTSGPAKTPLTEVRDDEAILNFIFDPKKSFIGAAVPDLPPGAARPKSPEPMEGEAAAKALEKEAVAKAEASDLDAAMELLEKAAETCPTSGSVQNNMTQLLRLRGDAAGAMVAATRAVDLEREWLAANEACKTSGAWRSHKSTMQKALTQRAVLRRESGDEAGADADLGAAAAHGSALAKALTTGTNPYATMCHAAVASMTEELDGKDKPTDSEAAAAKE